MLELRFPRLITSPNSGSVLSLCNQAVRTHQSQILFDLSTAEFITPFGVTVISGTISKCLELGKNVRYQRPRNDKVDKWLSSISFTRFFEIDRLGAPAKNTGIELRQLKGLNPIYVEDLVGLIDGNMNLSRGVRDSIQLSTSELLTNVFDHSKSQIGCFVCAQLTPKSKLIRLAVADLGIGILKSLRSAPKYSNLRTAHQAITLAVEEGVSSRKGKAAGLGLRHIRRFAAVNQGTLTVITGDGKVNFYQKSFEHRPVPCIFDGTVIELRINAEKEGFYFLTSEKKYFI